MGNQYLFLQLRSKIGTLVLWGLLFGVVGFFGLLMTEKPFQTKMDFLVVQANASSQDFYSLFKSSEYLGKVLSEAVYSERFINALVETGKVNKEFLPFDKGDRLATWSKMVKVEKNLELGILSVTVSGERERDVARIMDGIAQVLTEKNALFRGGDEKSVEIRILSGPIVSENPDIAKIVKVVVAAFLAGVFLAAFSVIVKAESSYRSMTLTRDDEVPLNEMLV
jgi:capsular polysaccharide biosynthesis protein